MQLFSEHVLLKCPFDKSVAYLIRLQLVSVKLDDVIFFQISLFYLQHLKSNRNFMKASTLKVVQSHLSLMEKEVKKKRYCSTHRP